MVGLTSIEQAIELILLNESQNFNSIKDLSNHWDLSEIRTLIDLQIEMLKD